MNLSLDQQVALIALHAHIISREAAEAALAAGRNGGDVETVLRERGGLGPAEIAALRTLAVSRSRQDGASPSSPAPGESSTSFPAGETVVMDEGPIPASPETRFSRAPAAKYGVVGKLAAGGSGVVYRVLDRDLGREVAMKVLMLGPEASHRQRERFIREATLAGRLEHPNIVPVYDFGERDQGDPYFTMRLVRGRTLSRVLGDLSGAPEERPREFSRARLLQIFQSVCMGVAYAHDHGVIHRDLKPDNIMIGDYGEVLILDWGLAKYVREPEVPGGGPIPEGTAAHVTVDGTVVGTPAYMSPEQAEGRVADVDEKTDIYALGAILYEVLTLRAPFEGDDARTVVDRVARGEVVPPRERAPEQQVPAELEEMCLRALARRKEDRPASAKALADDVLTYLEGAREKARRRREADAALGAGREIARRYFAVKEVLSRYAEIHAGIAARFRGHEPVSEKKELWALEDQIEQMHVQRNRRFADSVRKLGSVLEIEPENRTARGELAELYWDRFLESEARNDRADMDYALATVKFYNDGSLDERIRGDGSLAVETDPPGVEAYLYEHTERDRILVPEWGRPLGRTPVARFSLPMGSYLLHLRMTGKRDSRAPILVTRQEAVTARVRLFSDAEIGQGFVHVPAGPFIFGGDSQATSHRPKAVVRVDDYFIGKFPVTMGEYLEFLNGIGAEEAARRVPRSVGIGELARRGEGGTWRVPRADEGGPFPVSEDLPALGVSWEDAVAYGAWRSARDGRRYDLPTEEQWEKAARGVDGRFYPWGDKFDATYCKCSRSRPGEPAAERVGAYPEDESPYGVRDMAGGVRQWCATRAASKADVRHLRGGSWLHSSTAARCASRAGDMANAALYIYGFRLATTEPAVR